jgi:peptide/nickel transport system substrate-binding protein
MDAYAVLQALVHSAGAAGEGNGESNWGRYRNPTLDTLMKGIRVEPDMTKRNAMIRDVLTIQRDDLAVIPLYQVKLAWAMRKDVDAPYVPNSYPYWYRFSVK